MNMDNEKSHNVQQSPVVSKDVQSCPDLGIPVSRPVPQYNGSIFDLAEFPQTGAGRPYVVTPTTWRNITDDWVNGKALEVACNERGVQFHQYSDLNERFDELMTYYERARLKRAHAAVAECLAIADAPLEADPTLAMAGVRRSDVRIGHRQWLAERLHPAAYGSRTTIETKNLNANININMSLEDLSKAEAPDIISMFRGNR
jgi:hypothetical protein